MRRRDFIALCGGAVVCPVATSAQQGERVRLIGILNILGRDDPEAQVRLTIFQEALKQLGWERGRDFKIESRQVGGDVDRLRRYAAELVALGPDVILSIGSISVGALQQATHTIPIVFVNVPDPVGAGFVQNMAHPGGNITGFSNFEYSMSGKWAELLKQAAPQITRSLVLRDPTSAAGIGQFASVRSVAQSLGVELTPLTCTIPARLSVVSRRSHVQGTAAPLLRPAVRRRTVSSLLIYLPVTNCRRFILIATTPPTAALIG